MRAKRDMIELHLKGRGIASPPVLRAMMEVPREKFVPPEARHLAYADHPLPIGFGQTISQPYMVAAMAELLDPSPGDAVLEIGTGCGYQAAILSRIVRSVFSVEIIKELSEEAADRLESLGYGNIHLRVGDGYLGWPDQAPFDGIIVGCCAETVPASLVEQLKPGGRMVIPVGSGPDAQQLLFGEKKQDGSLLLEPVMPVRFVPMTRDFPAVGESN